MRECEGGREGQPVRILLEFCVVAPARRRRGGRGAPAAGTGASGGGGGRGAGGGGAGRAWRRAGGAAPGRAASRAARGWWAGGWPRCWRSAGRGASWPSTSPPSPPTGTTPLSTFRWAPFSALPRRRSSPPARLSPARLPPARTLLWLVISGRREAAAPPPTPLPLFGAFHPGVGEAALSLVPPAWFPAHHYAARAAEAQAYMVPGRLGGVGGPHKPGGCQKGLQGGRVRVAHRCPCWALPCI